MKVNWSILNTVMFTALSLLLIKAGLYARDYVISQ